MIIGSVNKLVDVATNLFGMGGEDRELTRVEAVEYCRRLDKKFNVKLALDYETVLRENRREPNTDYAKKTGRIKGNRAKYGVIPYERKGQAVYYWQSDLDIWFEAIIKPMNKLH